MNPPPCSACGSPSIRYACRVCAGYAFCSQDCGDAVASQHHANCQPVLPQSVDASLATWRSYGPDKLADNVQSYVKPFASAPNKYWVLKQVYRRELQDILVALDAALKTKGLSSATHKRLEALREQVHGYISGGD
jgi:hypothetical protein